MPQSSEILQPDTSRAHLVAQGVLCTLAGACVVAAAYGFSGRSNVNARRSSDAHLAQAEAALLAPSAARPMVSVAPILPPTTLTPPPSYSVPPPTVPAPLTPSTPYPSSLPPVATAPSRRPAPPPISNPSPKLALPLGKELKDPQAEEAVIAARSLREQGDMQAAIESLKAADLRVPDHPEIVGEMALTYEEMGVTSKAEPLWRQIYTMGEANAGEYYTLASGKIGNRGAAPAAAQAAPSPVSLGACQLTSEPLAKQGERVSLRVPILATPGATIDPTKVEIHVTLYESVNNGERIEAVPQDKTTPTWSTLPLDWRDAAGEAVDVKCDIFPQRQGTEGTRTFHGHVVKLYYQDKLAGEQAQPDSLLRGAPGRTGPAGLDNALFPK